MRERERESKLWCPIFGSLDLIGFPSWPFVTESVRFVLCGRYSKKRRLSDLLFNIVKLSTRAGLILIRAKLRFHNRQGSPTTLLNTARHVVPDLRIENESWRAEIQEGKLGKV